MCIVFYDTQRVYCCHDDTLEHLGGGYQWFLSVLLSIDEELVFWYFQSLIFAYATNTNEMKSLLAAWHCSGCWRWWGMHRYYLSYIDRVIVMSYTIFKVSNFADFWPLISCKSSLWPRMIMHVVQSFWYTRIYSGGSYNYTWTRLVDNYIVYYIIMIYTYTRMMCSVFIACISHILALA
jgi:hypothetical protein